MIYELRIYHCVPGRIGDLNNRFANFTTKLWKKHGIRPVGFWTTLVGPSNQTLHYMLAWESMAEREKKWGIFSADPAWLAIRAKTEANGQLIERIENLFLNPTSYSKMK